MKKKTMIITFFPTIFIVTIIIVAIMLLSMLPLAFSGMELVIPLVMIFPLLFFIQGIMGVMNRVAFYLSMGIPLFATMLFIIWLESGILGAISTMAFYGSFYLSCGVVGYGVGKFVCRLKEKRKTEIEKTE